jgi:protein SCO1/2
MFRAVTALRSLSRCATMPTRCFSRLPTKLDEPNEVAKEILEEAKQSTKIEDPKTYPGLFYAAAGGLVAMMLYMQYLIQSPRKQSSKPFSKAVGEAVIGGPWTILNSEGSEVSDTDYHGKYLVLYFGFTKCPDVCPSSLKKLASAIEILQKSKGINKLAFAFISLDPERDSPALVDKYVKVFSPHIEGLVVPEAKVQNFTQTFRLYNRKVPSDDGGYTLDHTTYMYLMDPQGKFVNVLGASLSYDELAEAIATQTS